MPNIIKTTKEWKTLRQGLLKDKTIGVIPTMGALHEGHLSLMRRSLLENDITMATLFVNPTQFNDPSDLDKYPRTFEGDVAQMQELNVDYCFYPDYKEIYHDDYRYKVSESKLSTILCGAARPGHFDGVLTVVMKLLNIADADRAYFGEKDYQQLLLVKEMTEAFFHRTVIVPCETVREADGLAMSSRNRLLKPEDRELAPRFYQALSSDMSCDEIKAKLEGFGFKIDYIEEHFQRRFGAVFLGDVRLIDNVPVKGKL